MVSQTIGGKKKGVWAKTWSRQSPDGEWEGGIRVFYGDTQIGRIDDSTDGLQLEGEFVAPLSMYGMTEEESKKVLYISFEPKDLLLLYRLTLDGMDMLSDKTLWENVEGKHGDS